MGVNHLELGGENMTLCQKQGVLQGANKDTLKNFLFS